MPSARLGKGVGATLQLFRVDSCANRGVDRETLLVKDHDLVDRRRVKERCLLYDAAYHPTRVHEGLLNKGEVITWANLSKNRENCQ